MYMLLSLLVEILVSLYFFFEVGENPIHPDASNSDHTTFVDFFRSILSHEGFYAYIYLVFRFVCLIVCLSGLYDGPWTVQMARLAGHLSALCKEQV